MALSPKRLAVGMAGLVLVVGACTAQGELVVLPAPTDAWRTVVGTRGKQAELSGDSVVLPVSGRISASARGINAALLSADGTLGKALMPDLLHPNQKGYEIWQRAMAPTLQELLSLPQ